MRPGLRVLFSALGLMVLGTSAGAASGFRDAKRAALSPGTVHAGNGVYAVHVEDVPGSGVGLYTATTGEAHPAGPGLNVLYGDAVPGTSFNTVRSYTTGTDYVQGVLQPASLFPVVPLDPYGVVEPLGSTGFRTTYALPGPPETPDALLIVSDVKVNGTGFEDSTIEVTTAIYNAGGEPVQIGVRYHWDFQIGTGAYGGDDGPTLQPQDPAGPVLVQETEFRPPEFESYRVVDNDSNPSPPTLEIRGTVVGPRGLTPAPTAPDLFQFVCWEEANLTAFEYQVDPDLDIATVDSPCRGYAGGDTAVHYFFGADRAAAAVIPPGAAHTVSASLFLRPALARVPVDVKPGSCPNPWNPTARGVLPVAVPAAPGFDPAQLDPRTVRLAGVAPLRWSLEDVGGAAPPQPSQAGSPPCPSPKPDGRLDLALKFSNEAVAAAVEAALGRLPRDREVVVLRLTGNRKAEFGGAAVEGEDRAVVRRNGNGKGR